ncbi:MAG: prolipoprotein diacylglyceryl transferase [Methylococcaceae bacterium]|nr:prolipoprotein diacylglyceryl transferase [Methylococcaceae bacterium]MCI0733220.1 prolipoprotein diacylglyceryl transferase [Methylococcaceae bacterium]
MEHFVWNVDPVFFSFGPVTVHWYGLFFALGFFQGFVILNWMFRRENRPVADLDDLFVYVFVGVLVGARLGHCLFYDPGYYLSHPVEILKIWKGGLASHGGAVGVLLAGYIFSRRNKSYSVLWILDRGALPLATVSFFIRIGNLFNSEIVGLETAVPWAFVFERVDDLPRHPVQLYEALSYLAISGLILYGYVKWVGRTGDGFLIGMYLVLMFSTRFGLEFFKTRQASYEAGYWLSVGQWLSVPFILAGIFLVVRGYKFRNG